MSRDDFDNVITKNQLKDMMEQTVASQLVNNEELFKNISINPNYEKYKFVERLLDMAGIDKGQPLREMLLGRIKEKGITQIVIQKLNSYETIMIGGNVKSPYEEEFVEKEVKKEDKLELEI